MSKRSRRRQQARQNQREDIDSAHARSLAESTHPTSLGDALRYNYLPGSIDQEFGKINPHKSHSVPIRTVRGKFARQLLGGKEEPQQPATSDDRPLIDKVHEATFGDSVGMQWIDDKYALRMALRKAHRFTVNAETSALMADFSIAIGHDLDAARRLALPPYPTTWFDIDNIARLNRMREHGQRMTANAAPDVATRRVGWLITPHNGSIFDYCATYFTDVGAPTGIATAPLAFCWRVGEPTTGDHDYTISGVYASRGYALGVIDCDAHPRDASVFTSPFRNIREVLKQPMTEQEEQLQTELAGELRHIWGLLIALGAGSYGAASTVADSPTYRGPRRMIGGKELLPLEQKTLTIKLGKKATAKTVAVKAIFHARKRWHEVRAHFREYRNEDGSVRLRVPVKAHERGEKRLGVIEKTYNVEK